MLRPEVQDAAEATVARNEKGAPGIPIYRSAHVEGDSPQVHVLREGVLIVLFQLSNRGWWGQCLHPGKRRGFHGLTHFLLGLPYRTDGIQMPGYSGFLHVLLKVGESGQKQPVAMRVCSNVCTTLHVNYSAQRSRGTGQFSG